MNETLTSTLFLIFKKVLLIIALLSFVFSDDSWKVYDESDLAYIHITVDPEDLEWMYDNVESDSMHLATLQFQNAFINETVDSIGFRLRGNTSRNADKKSFKVDFNHFISGREFYGLQKLNLNGEHNDPSIIRSKLSWDFYEDIGMKSSRASHATLYINNEYFGLYISIEHIDDTFLTRNFENDKGNLWKCIWPADLTYRGNEPDDYHPYYSETRPYELKTNKNDYEYVKLARLINVIHETPDSLEMVLDIKTTLQYFAMNVLTGSWDDYRFLRNNFYLYHNPDDDLIYWLPFDYDNSFGIDWFNIDWSTIDPYEYAVIDNDGRPLTDYLFSQQRYRNLFSHFLQFYNQQLFHLDSIYETLNNFSDHLYSAAEYDIYRTLDYGFSINDFLNSYGSDYENAHVKQGILEFIAERKESLNEQIAFDGYNPIIYESSIEQNIMMVGESINVKASIWGNVLNAQFFYRHVNAEEWSSVPLFFNPITESKRVEDHDQWLAEFIPLQSGDYDWYVLASNETEDEKFPVYDYRSFEVLNPITNQSLLINEMLANNVTTNMDEAGEYDDWVELWNNSDLQADLTNHFLTDKRDNLTKWKFPDSSYGILPNNYILIWCDEDQDQGNLHTNFKLSSGGEFLALIHPDGETILDSVTFPYQQEDISYGRVFTQGYNDEWDYLSPTPLSSNTSLQISNALSANSFELKNLYPNPFNSNFQISLNIDKELGPIKIDVISLIGRTVESKIIYPSSLGFTTISMEMDNTHASGTYFLKITMGNNLISEKVLLLK